MWVSRRTDYATRALIALALDGGGPDEARGARPANWCPPVGPRAADADDANGRDRPLRARPAGGYRLNKPPEEITLERVVRLFQGQLAPIGYATRSHPDLPEVRRRLAP